MATTPGTLSGWNKPAASFSWANQPPQVPQGFSPAPTNPYQSVKPLGFSSGMQDLISDMGVGDFDEDAFNQWELAHSALTGPYGGYDAPAPDWSQAQLNLEPFQNIEELASSTELSPWAMAQQDLARQEAATQGSEALSRAAMAGGIRGGAAERIGMASQRAGQDRLQQIGQQDLLNKYNLQMGLPELALKKSGFDLEKLMAQGGIRAGQQQATALLQQLAEEKYG